MCRFELDQSTKWEQSGPTAIGAYASGYGEVSIYIDARTKTEVNKYLRRRLQEVKKSKKAFQVRCFTYLVFLCMRKVLRPEDAIKIDIEYEGQDDRIRDILIDLFKKHEERVLKPENICFGSVGKNSKSHVLAIRTAKGQRKPDYVAKLVDFLQITDKTEELRMKAFRRRKNRKRNN